MQFCTSAESDMSDEYTQAISFLNGYFTLIDGLASGLENCLAEDVILDWFGRTIKGRKNVTAFIRTHKVTSRHIFSVISPVASIRYRKDRLNRKRIFLSRNKNKLNNEERLATVIPKNELFPDESLLLENDCDESTFDEETIESCTSDEDVTYDLNGNDPSTPFKLEITSTDAEEIERSINRLKLEEEMAPTIKAVKRECGQGDGPDFVKLSTIKYVEASGQIEFSRSSWKNEAWDEYTGATLKNDYTWKRPCKLQVAYSIFPLRHPSKSEDLDKLEMGFSSTSHFETEQESKLNVQYPYPKLLSFEEIGELTDRLVPNSNEFDGYLKNNNFLKDREDFMKDLGTEILSKEPESMLVSPYYAHDKLCFDRPFNKRENESSKRSKFTFNYQIHLIIYEGSNRCKVNLLQKFEKQG